MIEISLLGKINTSAVWWREIAKKNSLEWALNKGKGFLKISKPTETRGVYHLQFGLRLFNTSHDRGLVLGEMNKWCKMYQRNWVKIFKTCKRNFQENYWSNGFPTQISGIVGENWNSPVKLKS